MKKFDYVFLDMDDVLSDFTGSAKLAHSDNPNHIMLDWNTWPRGVWDMAGILGISQEVFWRKVEEHNKNRFWSTLYPLPWTFSLIEKAKQVAKEVQIVTATSKLTSPQCYKGKREWVLKHCPELTLNFVQDKHLLAGPRRVLIDDKTETIAKFNRHGGIGILFPRPWNTNHTQWQCCDEFTYRSLENELRK